MTAPAVARRWREPFAGSAPQAALRQSVVARRGRAPLAALLFTGLVVHAAVVPHLAVRRLAPDVLLVLVVAVAARRGERIGAAFGFAAGLGADLFLASPLGTSALAYTLVGQVLGRSSRPASKTAAAALCSPISTCFACRTGRRHGLEPAGEHTPRSNRSRRRAAARRAALRQSLVLVFLGVGAGRLAVAVVATSLGGLPFPEMAGLFRIAGVAALSAPLAPAAMAVVRRFAGGSGVRW